MADTTGSTAYKFNELSRLEEETKTFTDSLPNAPNGANGFRLQYKYDLAGQLTKLVDPYGAAIDYGYDKTGRLQQVTGSAFGAAGVTQYASGAKYRAWGALKELSYGNGVKMTETFNNRLQPAAFEVGKAGQPAIIKKSYGYTGDGMPSYTKDLLDERFDRLNVYDHRGQISQAKTSREARSNGADYTNQTEQEQNLPYRQEYEFNHFGNLTRRDNLHWGHAEWAGQNFNLQYTMENNRVMGTSWTYDADGRVLTTGLPDEYSSVAYDAAGRIITTTTERTANRYYDGDGREAKRWLSYWNESDPQNPVPVSEVTYYIRSSVLGGAVVSEADWKGRKEKTFVLAAGAQVAWQAASYDQAGNQTGEVYWNHSDPSGSTYRATTKDGAALYHEAADGSPAEFDPMGQNVGLYNPYYQIIQPAEPPSSPTLQPFGEESPMSVGGMRMSATLDGMAIPMSIVRQLMESGAAAMEFRIGTQIFQAPITSYGAGIFRVDVPRWVSYGYRTDGGQTDYTSHSVGDSDVIRVNTNLQNLGGYWTSSATFLNIGWLPQQSQNSAAQTTPKQTTKELQDSVYKKFGQKMEDCVKTLITDYVKKNVKSKEAKDAWAKVIANTILTRSGMLPVDASMTSLQIAKKFKLGETVKGKFVYKAPYGLPDVSNGGFTVLIGKEFFDDPSQWTESRPDLNGRTPLENAYVHEFGNLVSYHLFRNFTQFGDKNASDPDSGYALQKCVFGN